MSFRKLFTPGAGLVCLCMSVPSAWAGIAVYKVDNGQYVKMGGRIQLQYHFEDPNGGSTSDEVFFRRLRPYVEGSLHPDWKGKFQSDFGKSSGNNEVAVKDA